MKKAFVKRFISTLTILIMLLGLVPNVFAAYEDGQECPGCSHYHWDEYMCGVCGYCSIECTNAQCFVDSHCNECGKCLTETVWCSDCMTCEECYVYNGWHCLGCNDCYFTNPEDLCGECWFCESCMGAFCDDCGFCAGCQELDGGVHCVECGNCYAPIGPCENDGDHCKECCLICEACDMCVFDDGLEICPECNLCELCCRENVQSEGCDCGEYCVEQSDWFEHICPDCATPFCNVEMCELCNLCLDCCEGNSDCSDGMCVNDPEYDEHFCDDCGECTHNIDLCSICYDAGELRCEDCCDVLAEEEGCDCGDMCINAPDFYTHITQEHLGEGGSHAATPQSIWMFNEDYHWHECKYCDEQSHSKLGVNYHDFNNYDVCKICGYNKKDKILILKQPISRVCSVSDTQAPVDDSLYPYNNKVKFTVSAKGLSKLSYQWYYSYGGKWFECKDVSDKVGATTYVLSRGSKTNAFSTDVPADICYSTCYYKCVITDEDGNTVETAPASIRSRHIYKVSKPQHLERITDIYSDKTHFVTAYTSTGHYMECVGDGCEEYHIKPHNFEKTKTIVTCYYTHVEWIKSVCRDCGYEKYIKNHDHVFIDTATGDCDIDYSYESNTAHKLSCLFDGCDKTTLENHTYMPWQNVGSPYNTQSGIGNPYKECQLCSYQYTKKPQRYDKAQGKNVNCDWTKSNDLVSVKYGGASSDIVYVGDKLIVSFNPSSSDKADYIKLQYPKCIAWNVYYYCDTGKSVIDKNVSQYFSFTRIKGTANWEVSIPEFADRKGGGTFTFEPIIDSKECTHTSGTRLSGAYEPVCVQDGYTGDTVCVDCSKVIKYGEIIEGGSEHEGELILNPLTVRQGTCEHRGYSGTSRCSVCNMAVRGKSTPKVHTGKVSVIGATPSTCYEFGETGDSYCECGAHLKSSKLIAPEHKNTKIVGYIAPTPTKDGYTGDTVCEDCDLILKYGYTLPSDKIIFSITIEDVVAPVSGENPDFTAKVTTAGVSRAAFSTLYINRGVDWKDTTYLNYVYPHNTFKRSMNYMVTVRVETTNGNIFAENVSATINGKTASVYVDPSTPDFATVTYEFPYTVHATVKEINITGVTPPLPGTNPVFECTLDNPYYYEIDELWWAEANTNLGVTPEETFEKNKKYIFGVGLSQYFDKGSETAVFDPNVKAYINGIPATMERVDEDYVFFYAVMTLDAAVKGSVSSSYDANDETVIHLIEKGKTEPAYEFVSKGNSFDFEFESVPQGTYVLKATKKNHKVYTGEIEVCGEDVIKNITLLPEANIPIDKEHTHEYTNDCDKDCNICGETRTVAGHKYTNSCDTTCNICKAKRTITHKYGEYTYNNDATCDKDGTKTRICSVCKKEETVTAKGTKLINSSKTFKDVPANAWYKKFVDFAVTNGIFKGTSDKTFSPEQNMTRAQFVMVFANLSGIDTSNNNVKSGFKDVPKGKWYTAAVTWAAKNNIVSGVGDGKFDPEAKVTREQMCVMLVNYIEKYQKKELKVTTNAPKFADDKNISSWAKTAVYKCAKAGLVNGVGNNKFDPGASATRAQGATIFTSFYKEYMK